MDLMDVHGKKKDEKKKKKKIKKQKCILLFVTCLMNLFFIDIFNKYQLTFH